MPIIIKDYTWTQTAQSLSIKIPLNSGNKNNIDLFTTDSYIKINYAPFLFEMFLLHDVDNDKSKCTILDDLIVLDMIKRQEHDWECLEKCLSKEEKKELRQKIYKKSQEEAKERAEQRSIKKSQLDRFTVQRAMDIDSKQHSLMDSRRDAERNKAMNELEQWRETLPNERNNDSYNNSHSIEKHYGNTNINKIKFNEYNASKIIELTSSDEENDEGLSKKNSQQIKNLPIASKIVKQPIKSEYVEKKKLEAATRVLPKPRETRQLEIKHTPRSFPTPSRESTVKEEEAWLKNVTQARRATGFVSEDLRPEEQDPQWCKEKGDEFFRSGNFLGAISAYTHGMALSDKLPSLYSNRAATHFPLGNFNKCVNDCSTALDLMKPPCEGNRRSRAKCIARRAAALARLGFLSKAIDEMKAASKLLPDDEKIKKDIYDMERAWEQNPDSD
ncbi:unnamed protein product [Parnassius apollo]|uniref:(apollo) hypothetical protein n=1 Tax=Parnassius apollo TaxID=110799 RepID=A0A8S3W870_PARAO|nr:unnamed protein product [Parnassius apollo]